MQVDLDIQEREVIKQYAKQMLALFRSELRARNTPNVSAVDDLSIAFWMRLVEKMDEAQPEPKPRLKLRSHPWY